jgi:hypothetical protein
MKKMPLFLDQEELGWILHAYCEALNEDIWGDWDDERAKKRRHELLNRLYVLQERIPNPSAGGIAKGTFTKDTSVLFYPKPR